ncbi:TonB-dependent siderophore receptor [Zymobacter sp. IVIA_12111.31 C1]|uniref:TonB-dependent siderophore receptor n=1 Tax=Zymobacter sp. IVIA_12111.31 C1 TaxID=3394854 RepID=UPI0039C28F07
MSIIRRYSIALSGVLLLPVAQARALQRTSDVYEVTASKVSPDSASSQNAASTVVNAPALRAAGVTDTEKLDRVLPGLHMENAGSLLFPSISLRGVTSAQDPYNPALSVYVDGVPQLSTNTIQALTDVQSVELLRGPQGTLYGKSAQGGVINITTRRPTNTPHGYIEGGIESRDGYHSKLHLSGPLQKGLLYGSMTLQRQVDGGDMTNPATGHDDLGGAKANTGNVKLLLAPDNQPWEIGVSATRECTRATQDTYVAFGDPHNHTLSVVSGSPDPYLDRCTNSQTLTGKYTTDAWTFSLINAWQQQHYDRIFPNSTLIANTPERWNQNLQELRATTNPGGPVDVTLGLYRQNTRENLDMRYDMPTGNYLSTQSRTTSNTLAAYSDLTWHVTDRIDLGGGLRFSHDKASTHYSGSMLGSPFGDQNSSSDDQVLGQLSAGYMLNDDWRVYTRIAQGYKPSGYNIVPSPGLSATPFAAERSINYELGARYESDAVRLQSAVFHTHTKDLQLYSGAQGLQTLTNAGTADATGVELEAAWQFTPSWSWDINGNVVHSVFANDSDSYAGKRTPFTPRYTLGSGLSGHIDTSYGALTPRLAGHVVGSHYFEGDNTLRQGTYATVDARLGWQATQRLSVELYADNLFDRRYFTYGYLSGSSAFGQVNMGRTIGLNVRADLF